MSKRKKTVSKTSAAKTKRSPILSGREAIAALKGKQGGKKRPWREQAAIINQERDSKIEETQAPGSAETNPAPEVADKQPAPPVEKKMSALDAAAKILAEAEMPLNTRMIVERMIAQGLWTTQGRTPSATIYSSLIREIAAKGEQARFKKTNRGLFVLRKN